MKHRLLTLAVIAPLAMALWACGKKEDAAQGGAERVEIGSVAPLTGPQAHLGKDNDNGARMAVDDLNAQGVTIGGKKVVLKLISEDDQIDPKVATIVAQKLADRGIKGVIGHLNSGTTIPASKIYFDAGIVQISPSATAVAYTAQGFNTAFRVMTNDLQQGKALGEYAVLKMGAKQVAIIDDRTAYGQGLADEFEKAVSAAGGTIIAREYTTDRSTDFLAILTAIKAKKPDLVFYGGMDVQAAPLLKQMRSLGIAAQFLGGDGMQHAEFLKLAGADADGATASSPGTPIEKMPRGKEFNERFTAKYGVIQNYAPYAYDAVMVMVEAMKQAGSTDPKKYLPEMAKLKYQGVTGEIAFDGKGDLQGGGVTIYRVNGGQWVPMETVVGGAAPAAGG